MIVLALSHVLVSFPNSNTGVNGTRHITEPATIALEDRQLFQTVIAEAIQLKRKGRCDGLVFSRCDRLSRQMEGAIQVALDLRKVGLAIVLVRENQVLKPDDPH